MHMHLACLAYRGRALGIMPRWQHVHAAFVIACWHTDDHEARCSNNVVNLPLFLQQLGNSQVNVLTESLRDTLCRERRSLCATPEGSVLIGVGHATSCAGGSNAQCKGAIYDVTLEQWTKDVVGTNPPKFQTVAEGVHV
jgi:hypothetical protein